MTKYLLIKRFCTSDTKKTAQLQLVEITSEGMQGNKLYHKSRPLRNS